MYIYAGSGEAVTRVDVDDDEDAPQALLAVIQAWTADSTEQLEWVSAEDTSFARGLAKQLGCKTKTWAKAEEAFGGRPEPDDKPQPFDPALTGDAAE